MTDEAKRRIHPDHDGMRETLRVMQEARDALRAEYEAAAQDCIDAEKGIETMERWAEDNRRESLPATTAPALPVAVSFDECRNPAERLAKMAESWGGTVNCNDAADLLISSGVSKSVRANLSSALQKQMGDREDLWEYVGPRTYRYLPYQSTHNSAVSDPAQRGPE